MRKIAGYVIILHICTKNHNHRRYGSWDTEWDRQKFLSFWSIVWSFTPLLIPKIKIWKKCKKHLEILSFYTSVPQMTNMMYSSWDMERNRPIFFVILDYFLPFYPPDKPENENFEKMKEAHRDIIFLHMCTVNENHMIYG